jgi:NAD(P)-dependent dehydrogenase (short-subunit alcohol dehydrogenase family)
VVGKTAVITGGDGLLGKAFKQELEAHGATVINADISTVDLSDERSVIEWANGIKQKFKRINILINNAACKTEGFFAPVEKYTLEDWNKVMSVNLTAMFLMVRELAPLFKRGTSIINISSIYGITGPDQRVYRGAINTPLVYSVSKAGVIGLTKYLATYWGDKGIRTNCIVPGGVYDGQDTDFVCRYSSRVPLGRMAEVEDIVGAMMFLVQNKYMNGQAVVVDGGLTAW